MKLDGAKSVIEHFIRDCEVRPLSPYTLKNYRHHLGLLAHLLKVLCDVTDLEQVTVLHLRECVACLLKTPLVSLASKYSDNPSPLDVNTVRAHVRVWKSFFGWCYREELIERNPADRRLALPKPLKKVTETFSDEHLQKILSSCDLSTDEGYRDYIVLLLLLDTGVRLAEIGNLRLEDFHDSYIKVLGKGRKEREIGLHPEVGKMLWRYIHKFRKPVHPDEPSLFLSCGKRNRGQAFRAGGVSSLLRRIKRVTGLDVDANVRLSAHTFRHTFARMYMEQGGEILSLSRELGHSDVGTTRTYVERFGSTEARREHTSHSPIARLNLKKQQKRKPKRE
ncbi:MAG TPA: tyrosine-type recombinase/integrase [Ktedonobacteraceae bacterium]|nr:tyrosine-type recombinase/integrase [Ktedonobacteraceae bacterium]